MVQLPGTFFSCFSRGNLYNRNEGHIYRAYMGERNFIMIRNENNINKDKADNNRININRSNWNKMLVAGAIAGCVISGAA